MKNRDLFFSSSWLLSFASPVRTIGLTSVRKLQTLSFSERVLVSGQSLSYSQNDHYHCTPFSTLDLYARESTYIAQKKPNQNFSHEDRIEVDKNDSHDGEKRILIGFDVNSIPNKEHVVKIELELYSLDSSPSGGKVHLVDDRWSEESVTWNNDPDVDEYIGEFAMVNENKYARIDITNQISAQELFDNSNFQHGLYLISDSTDGADYAKSGDQKPKLIITYKGCDESKLDLYASESTYIAEKKPNQNFSHEDRIEVDKNDSHDGEKRILIGFDVNLIPNKEHVVKMELELYSLDASPSGGMVHLVDDRWSEESVTWNNNPDVDEYIGEFGMVNENKYTRIDITNQISAQELFDNSNFQHGLYLISDSADGADYAKSGDRTPKLIITYEDRCKCKVNLQIDGNLLVYRENKRIWSSGFYGNGTTDDVYMQLFESGELATFNDNSPWELLWSSNSGNDEDGNYTLAIMNDCRLAILDEENDYEEIWTNFWDSLSNGSRLQQKERFFDYENGLVMILQGDGNLIVCAIENMMGTQCTLIEWSAGVQSESDYTRLEVFNNPARLALFDQGNKEYWSFALNGCKADDFELILTAVGPSCEK